MPIRENQKVEVLFGVIFDITRTGSRNAELRRARICYNHLAGEMGIRLYESFTARNFLFLSQNGLSLTAAGEKFVTEFGIDLASLQRKKSPICKECLDWSERRSHMAGSLGRALLSQFEALGWTNRTPGTRIIRFTKLGETDFSSTFPA